VPKNFIFLSVGHFILLVEKSDIIYLELFLFLRPLTPIPATLHLSWDQYVENFLASKRN